MHIDVAQTLTHQLVLLDEPKHLGVSRDRYFAQVPQQRQQSAAIAKLSTRQFTKDKGVNEHQPLVQQTAKRRNTSSQVIDPD